MWTRLKSWWKIEGAMVEVSRLDDRLLADMGLTRKTLRKRLEGEADAADAPASRSKAIVCEGG